jgi:hypothetical protein
MQDMSLEGTSFSSFQHHDGEKYLLRFTLEQFLHLLRFLQRFGQQVWVIWDKS